MLLEKQNTPDYLSSFCGKLNVIFLKISRTKKEALTSDFRLVSPYISYLCIIYYIVSFMGVHHGLRGRSKNFKGEGYFEVAIPFLTTLYIPSCLICWSGLKWIKAPNAAISSGTKAEKATTSMVLPPTHIAGRCGTARGICSDSGPLSCLFFDP